MSENIRKDDELTLAFHVWKRENEITKLFFKLLLINRSHAIKNILLLSNAQLENQDKLVKLGQYSMVVSFIDWILELNVEEIKEEKLIDD